MRFVALTAALLVASPALAAESIDPLNRIASVTILNIYAKECVPKGNPPLTPQLQAALTKGLPAEDPADIAEMTSFLKSAVGLDKICEDFANAITKPDEE